MKPLLLACLLLCGTSRCLADDISGPNRWTFQRLSWGTLYYEPGSIGPFQFETTPDGFRLKSNQGEVTIKTWEVNGFQLTWGKEMLTIKQSGGDLDIQGQGRTLSLRSQNGRCTLTSSSPKDTLVFERNANTFSIKGAKGQMTATTEFQKLRITSPAGTTTIVSEVGKRTLSGVGLGQVPYLGRGFFIPFHGVGIFIDMAKVFPMQEVGEWIEWKPILGP